MLNVVSVGRVTEIQNISISSMIYNFVMTVL